MYVLITALRQIVIHYIIQFCQIHRRM